ncbi:PepSY domain-containing protein [Butyrivibrio sp. YAB3001]|uniref:PepSY domain-containing protein n=1 Tax=Butyrivibrio sp. YAB3001 TaxID=1520812 RepID=UPI0008F65D54|nr:PepSY domain-containing protein [Butyrivibrio sp. YAB3001]SFB71810.1 Peptidase propeptide and YPEB domain-containing protein [Butyrivibrio sp. YAB3001]
MIKKIIVPVMAIATVFVSIASVPFTAYAADKYYNQQIKMISTETGKNTEISSDKAIEIAMADAGYTKDDAIYAMSEKDDEEKIYEVEFRIGFVEYEYEISAVNGRILKRVIND